MEGQEGFSLIRVCSKVFSRLIKVASMSAARAQLKNCALGSHRSLPRVLSLRLAMEAQSLELSSLLPSGILTTARTNILVQEDMSSELAKLLLRIILTAIPNVLESFFTATPLLSGLLV